MGRRSCRVRLLTGWLVGLAVISASSCGLTPAEDDLQGAESGDPCPTVERPTPAALELGVVVEYEATAVDHVLCDVEYSTSPPTSGAHFPVWQACGFYTEPIRDETAVHSMEHGAIWIAYDPNLPGAAIEAIAALVATDGHYLAAPYPGLVNPIVVSAWQRQVAVEDISAPVVARFAEAQLGRVSETAPEAGATCESPLGVAPSEPDAGYRQIFDQLAAG
ncbi:MAG: DUF3105 domain-containing protein [Acidimicrobiales bacterium]